MLTRYHIGRNGEPALCRAKGRCPLVSELLHFKTKEEAYAYLEKHLEETLGSFPLVAESFLPFSQLRHGLNGGRENDYQKLSELRRETQATLLRVPEEITAVVHWYQGVSYSFVNAYLRGGKDGLRTHLIEEYGNIYDPSSEHFQRELNNYIALARNAVESLDTFLKKAEVPRPKPRVLYRTVGVPKAELEEFERKYRTNQIILEKSYLSTSVDSDACLIHSSFTRPKLFVPVIFELRTRRGAAIAREGNYHIGTYEREVLLPRNLSFRVVASGEAGYVSSWSPGSIPSHYRARRRWRGRVIQMEEVPGEG